MEKVPKIGDRKMADGREYIFLQLSPHGKPDWQSPEQIEIYDQEIEERRKQKKLKHAGIKQKKQKPTPDPGNPLSEQDDEDGIGKELTELIESQINKQQPNGI